MDIRAFSNLFLSLEASDPLTPFWNLSWWDVSLPLAITPSPSQKHVIKEGKASKRQLRTQYSLMAFPSSVVVYSFKSFFCLCNLGLTNVSYCSLNVLVADSSLRIISVFLFPRLLWFKGSEICMSLCDWKVALLLLFWFWFWHLLTKY